jgi:hypothetical protein
VAVDSPEQGFKAGDVVVMVWLDVPPPLSADDAMRHDAKALPAGWQKRGGKYTPYTGWADNLQNNPIAVMWLSC